MEKARNVILKIFKLLLKPEMRILPGQLAFFLVMTLIPMFALVATLAAALSLSTDVIREAISLSVPKQIADLLNGIINSNGINFNIIVFYFSAILLASNGAYSMINTSNEIYKIKPRNIISRRIKAIVMTFLLVGLFLFLIAVPVFGSTLFDIIIHATGNNTIVQIIQSVLRIIKYPLIVIILFVNIKLMYVIAPDQEIPAKTTNKGSIFTTICWILATEIFSFYISTFARYDIFYGSISNILVLLLWVYLLSYIFVFGMVVNASNYYDKDIEKETKELIQEEN